MNSIIVHVGFCWQARYKQALDPTVDEVKKLCLHCRKSAKSERVLFHYNGHGVPRPTINGEIWLFNKVISDSTLRCTCWSSLYVV